MSLRFVRSPVAPKMTMAQGGAGRAFSSSTRSRVSFATGEVMATFPFRSALRRVGRMLDVAAELVAHSGEHLVAEGVLLARAEAVEQRRRENVDGYGFLDGGLHRPSPFARIFHGARELRKLGALGEGARRQVEQPRRDDAATPPQLGDVGEVEIETMAVGKTFRSGVLEDVEAFGIGLHQSVLDTVVNHLHEVPGADRAAVQPAVLGGALLAFAAGRRWNAAAAGRQLLPEGRQPPDRLYVAADHQTVAAVEAPHAAAGAGVDVEDAIFRQCAGAPHVVLVVGVAAVDDDVSPFHPLAQRLHHAFRRIARGHHHPSRPRRLEPRDKLVQGPGSRSTLGHQLGHRGRVQVIDDALVPATEQAADHVAAHASEADHADLHWSPLFLATVGLASQALGRERRKVYTAGRSRLCKRVAVEEDESMGKREITMRCARTAGTAALLLALAGPARGEVAVTAKGGTLGGGVELTVGLSPQWNVRLGVNAYDYTDDHREVSGIFYDATAHLRTASALLDFHPGAGGFRLSAGAMYNDTRIDGSSLVPTSGFYDIGGTQVPAGLVGTLDGQIKFDPLVPYVGL